MHKQFNIMKKQRYVAPEVEWWLLQAETSVCLGSQTDGADAGDPGSMNEEEFDWGA